IPVSRCPPRVAIPLSAPGVPIPITEISISVSRGGAGGSHLLDTAARTARKPLITGLIGIALTALGASGAGRRRRDRHVQLVVVALPAGPVITIAPTRRTRVRACKYIGGEN